MRVWPNWVVFILMIVSAWTIVVKMGEEKRDTYSFLDLISVLIEFWLLYMGGFFSPIGIP